MLLMKCELVMVGLLMFSFSIPPPVWAVLLMKVVPDMIGRLPLSLYIHRPLRRIYFHQM